MRMKKLTMAIIAAALLLCAGCSRNDESTPTAPFNGMLDIDTGEVYCLGDQKEKFDNAFNEGKENADRGYYSYLSNNLQVSYDSEGRASKITVDGATNRFSFYNFTFATPIESIEGRYERSDVSGLRFYKLYFDENGDVCKPYTGYLFAELEVRDGDLLDMKDGQYLEYSIQTLDSLTASFSR